MSDLISRQAAIDIVRFECGKWEWLAKLLEYEINALPSAQPEPADVARDIATIMENEKDMRVVLQTRKRGKWVIFDGSGFVYAVCPFCGEYRYHESQKYCGECGAEMREDDFCSRAERRDGGAE